MDTNEKFMMRAIELARLGEGLTRPNPPVGAVLVLDGEVIAEGWHRKAGGDHAERACLKAWSKAHGDRGQSDILIIREKTLKYRTDPYASGAGRLKTATLYVTLEPCSTHGRTPPCTDLILEKGIGRVVVSVEDLNPKHAGRGLGILREAGVEVVSGVCEKEGHELVAPFEKFITTGLPYVTLKLASTLDGKIADRTGDSKWITGSEARERVQEMRRRADAIMVGAGTVRADDPSLLPRPSNGRKPWRVVIGENIPAAAKVLTDEAADRTIVFTVEGHQPRCPRTARPPSLHADSLQEALKALGEKHDVMHLLCEGGGQLAAGLVEEGLIDEFAFFVAPKLMGADGLPNFPGTGGLISNVRNLRFQSVEQVGGDVLIKAKVKH